MGKSINPMFSFTIRGEAPFGSAPSLIVLMSLQPAIPRQVALLPCLPPLHRLDSMFHLPAGTVNHHLTRTGEFSTGRTRNFQPELTEQRFASSRTASQYLKHSQKLCNRAIGGGSGPEKGADEGGWRQKGNQMSKGGEVDQFHE